jgi:RNA polymerase sigma-70 factor (ECF subfamily)
LGWIVSIDEGPDVEISELVRKAQAGENAAFDRLVDAFTPKLYRVVHRMAPDRMEAESIVQEAWLRAWRAFSGYVHDRPLFPWLAKIAVNVARDRWRKKSPLVFAEVSEAELQLEDLGPQPESSVERSELLDHLAEGVRQLREEYRLVIALRYDAGLSYRDIAEALDAPINTVRTHLRRAKRELRRWMEENPDGLDG